MCNIPYLSQLYGQQQEMAEEVIDLPQLLHMHDWPKQWLAVVLFTLVLVLYKTGSHMVITATADIPPASFPAYKKWKEFMVLQHNLQELISYFTIISFKVWIDMEIQCLSFETVITSFTAHYTLWHCWISLQGKSSFC